ncbi:MAG: hypothetical protein AABZ47_17790 [Planctomycetota bacterium]
MMCSVLGSRVWCWAFVFVLSGFLTQSSSWAARPVCVWAAEEPGGGQLLLILDHLSPCPPGSPYSEPATWEKGDAKNVVVTRDPQEFYELASHYGAEGKLAGTVVLQNNACVEVPIPFPSPISFTLTVYDEATLQVWAESGITPGFMTGLFTPETPGLEEAVIDIDFSIQYLDGTVESASFRVRRSDGAAALLSSETLPAEDQKGENEPPMLQACSTVPCSGAGHFWQGCQACCTAQLLGCNLVRSIPFIGPLFCNNCSGCYSNCYCCFVQNPCHSCGFCGLIGLLNFAGIGNG